MAPHSTKEWEERTSFVMIQFMINTKITQVFARAVLWASVAMMVLSCAGPGGRGGDRASTHAAQAEDPVIARGWGVEVRQSAMDRVLSSYKANSGSPQEPPPDGAEVQVLNQLIDIQLVLGQATPADKVEGKTQSALAMDEVRKSFASNDAFLARLKSTGITENELRSMITDETTARVALTHALGIVVGDQEVKDFFDSRGPGAYDLPERAHIRQILLWTTTPYTTEPLPAEVVQQKHNRIQELLRRARAGEDFSALAKAYSEDDDSKDRGGELPPFAREESDLAVTAFSMKPHEISDVIVSNDSFRIVQLIEILPPHKTELAEVTDRIRKFLIGKKTTQLAPAYLGKLRNAASVEIVDAKMKSAIAAAKAEADADAKAEADAQAESEKSATVAATEPADTSRPTGN